MPFMNILIPIDDSDDSLFACEIAVKLADPPSGGRTFHLVHCLEPIPSLIGGDSRVELQREQKQHAEDVFARSCALINGKGLTCKTYVRDGMPGPEIAQAARELRCEVIIMGTRGHGQLKSLMLGSVSQAVLDNATVPVLLANKPRHQEDA